MTSCLRASPRSPTSHFKLQRFSAGRLTPPGDGGLAVFRLDGAGVQDVLDVIFRPRHGKSAKLSELAYGDLHDGDDVLDEVVVRVHEGSTLTRADISVHGGPWVGGRLGELFKRLGAEPLLLEDAVVPPPQNTCAPAIYLEAHALLLAARSPTQVALALSAMAGTLGLEIKSIYDAISNSGETAHVLAAMRRLDSLSARAAFGMACSSPPSVALLGVPNAGKSTLFNSLCGADRAMVSPVPGTTRDRLEAGVTFGDSAFQLWDGAGIRATTDSIEQQGVELTRTASREADVLLGVFDELRPLADQQETYQALQGRPSVAVVTKADLTMTPGLLTGLRERGFDALLTAQGDRASLSRIAARVVSMSSLGDPCSSDQPVPFTRRQRDGIDAARASLLVSDVKRASLALAQVLSEEA